MTPLRFFLPVILIVVLCGLSLPVSVNAQDKKETAPEQSSSAALPADPALVKLEKRSLELVDTLGEEELKHLFHIRESFGSTRAVKVVRSDVQNAAKACGTANPDMKTEMDGRFAAWTESIDTAVKAKEKEIDAAIAAQTYLKPKEIRDYLKMIEKTANNVDKDITKIPVTTPEACTGLLKSMDSTETVLTKLIEGMELSPWPPVIEEEPVKKVTIPNN